MTDRDVSISNMSNFTEPIDNEGNASWYDGSDGPALHTRLAFAGAWILIAVAGILGNSLVIYVAIRFEKLSNVTNCFIVNLAITDIVFLVFCMPLLVVQYTLVHWYFNQTFCKLMNFISFVSVLVTVLTLVVMTIDRYIYVARPFENIQWRKPRTVFLLSLIIWLLSCTLASPYYYHYGVTDDDYKQCVLLTDENLQKHFRIYTVTLYYFIPLTIILICYTRLLYYVYQKENKVKSKTKSNVVKWSKKRRAVTKMVAIVTLVFSLCWLPLTLYIVSANVFEEKTRFLYYFKIIANSFAYLNSAVNPIIYAFLNRSFRTSIGSIFSRPACSIYFAKDSQQPQQELPSKQTERHYPSSKGCVIKGKQIVINNKNHLSAHYLASNDFSDAECESPDLDYRSNGTVQRINSPQDCSRGAYGTLLLEKQINGGSKKPQTTSL